MVGRQWASSGPTTRLSKFSGGNPAYHFRKAAAEEAWLIGSI